MYEAVGLASGDQPLERSLCEAAQALEDLGIQPLRPVSYLRSVTDVTEPICGEDSPGACGEIAYRLGAQEGCWSAVKRAELDLNGASGGQVHPALQRLEPGGRTNFGRCEEHEIHQIHVTDCVGLFHP